MGIYRPNRSNPIPGLPEVGRTEIRRGGALEVVDFVNKAWRREEDSYSHAVLKTRNLLKILHSQTAAIGQNAPKWNVTGTSLFIRQPNI
jgi:hypothetical protein